MKILLDFFIWNVPKTSFLIHFRLIEKLKLTFDV